jgi:hypothetical protein
MAECEVVRVEEEKLPPKARPKPGPPSPPTMLVAVRFTAIPEMAQDRIIRHMFRWQRQRRGARRS